MLVDVTATAFIVSLETVWEMLTVHVEPDPDKIVVPGAMSPVISVNTWPMARDPELTAPTVSTFPAIDDPVMTAA